MRITAKGQVTIPAEIREHLGLLSGTEVDFVVDGDAVRIERRVAGRRGGRGAKVVRGLRGTGTIQISTDEILALTRQP